MTEFEVQSLAIARENIALYRWSTVISGGALLVSIVAGIVAFLTLRVVLGQLQSAKWNALLSFEQDMFSRREKFQLIAKEIEDGGVSPSIKARADEAKESYLNAVERLASSILNGQFPEKEMKQSYREYIVSTIRMFPNDFRSGTVYRKTLTLDKKWED